MYRVVLAMTLNGASIGSTNDVFKAAMTNPVIKQEMDSQDDPPPAKPGH